MFGESDSSHFQNSIPRTFAIAGVVVDRTIAP
jgi:hypothetical protein